MSRPPWSLGSGLAYRQLATQELLAVQLVDRLLCLGRVGHLHKPKPSDQPVIRSLTIDAVVTSPNFPNASTSASSVAS